MKLNLLNRGFVIVLSLILGVGMAIEVTAAQKRGYATYESVNKTGLGAVYSLSTGSNTFYIKYGGSCYTSSIDVTPQVYVSASQSYESTINMKLSLKAGESDENRAYCSPFKMFRVEVSGLGTGMGYIQGLE